MGILVIGLGSMGTRRIRCLQALGYGGIVGYDVREDRRNQAKEKYNIDILESDLAVMPEKAFICTPPNTHEAYGNFEPIMDRKLRDIPCFVEAGTEELSYGIPSATMLFNPLVKIIREKVPKIGKLINITYHCGQYLPDWHPYEKVSDFYAADVGAGEMIAFELMWMTHVLGFPVVAKSWQRQNSTIEGLNGPDTILHFLGYDSGLLASVMIDVVSRNPVRQLIINGSEKQLIYDLNQGISEQMYVDETKSFMDGNYPNTLEHSNEVIRLTKGL